MPLCLIAIGCNQGDCRKSIKEALRKIDDLPNSRVVAVSQLQETRPVGNVDGVFLNGAATIETGLEPQDLMRHLLQLECDAGRDRDTSPGNRPLDLDILLFDQEILNTSQLTVPHPRMSFRRFVLEPAAEIASDMIHPKLQTTLGDLLQRIQTERNVVAVALPDSFDADALDLNPVGNVHWVWPQTQRELLASLRSHVSVNQHWLVVFSDHAGMLSQLNNAIKLLISIDAGAEQKEHLPDSFQGPQWRLGRIDAIELKECILDAIDSMRPVN